MSLNRREQDCVKWDVTKAEEEEEWGEKAADREGWDGQQPERCLGASTSLNSLLRDQRGKTEEHKK